MTRMRQPKQHRITTMDIRRRKLQTGKLPIMALTTATWVAMTTT